MPFPKSLLPLLPLISPTSAWGTLGHDTVAFIAQSLISPATTTFTQSLLNDSSSAFLANVATWADSYRYTAEGAFSAPLHYIDALDDPPADCNVDFDRDCPEEGCIVSAIANYTVRVAQTNISLPERQKALKWVVHFLGDVHQPLHVENLAIGGNAIPVSFANESTNLHHIWDSNMPENLRGGYGLDDAKEWADELVTAVRTGQYMNESVGWLEGMDVKDPVGSAMAWARDANAHVCGTVLAEGRDAVENMELGGKYYDAAVPVIQMQIAKAGVRLAAWLDLIVGAEGENEGYKKSDETVKKLVRRGEPELEDWMLEARRVRRAFGWNCGAEGHKH